MGDSLFGEDDSILDQNQQTQQTQQTDDKPDTVTLSKEDFETLKGSLTKLQETVETQAQQLQKSQTAQPQTQQTDNDNTSLTPDEAIKQFANDPVGFAKKVAGGEISQTIQQQIAPILNPIIQTAHSAIVNTERVRIVTGKLLDGLVGG